ncbi:PucR family transcriptional regulator [Streptacidiphilus jiangxiensis]|uniref:Purine catabolism regulatory protein n=1 Tax=Streptacidiphilus jiangxiensis TaxID=235985 RepID=A0A1H7UMI6_STRJI|nr:PucR family transcriptional regulator [Streptacidiphilus jiangxiensis]SEL98173.1 purine catabolism regulatory protein [Streptacidiphilus jiangxiensis]
MAPTLRELLDHPRLGLTLLVAGEGLDRTVRWVHASDLADPTPFLEPGLVLLTTWLLPRDEAATDAYVAALRAAGLVGLGFGYDATPRQPGCPPALVAAARRHGMPLFEVPVATPFIAVMRAVADAVAAQEHARARELQRAAQELTRAAAADDGARRVVMRLARAVDGWAVLVSPAGRAVHASPHQAVRRLPALADDIARLVRGGPHSSASLGVDGSPVLLQTLGIDRVRGLLAVGRGTASLPGAETFDPQARAIVDTAASLLTIRLERSRAQYAAERAVHDAVLALALAGRVTEAATVFERLGEQLPAGPLRLHLVAGPPEGHDALIRAVAAAAAQSREVQLSAGTADGHLAVIAPAEGALEAALPALAAQADAAVGSSAAHDDDGLQPAIEEARQALDAAHGSTPGPPRRHVRFDDLTRGRLLGLLGQDRLRTWADHVLAPLGDADRETLRAWLAHSTSVQETATTLGVHRNTVRQRLERIRELLDGDLDDPVQRAELLLALHTPPASSG